MKYEDYKKLSDAKKEEWNFRFGNKKMFMPIGAAEFIILIVVLTNLLLIFYVIVVSPQPEITIYKKELGTILIVTSKVIAAFLIIIVFEAVAGALHYSWHEWKEKKWIDKALKRGKKTEKCL